MREKEKGEGWTEGDAKVAEGTTSNKHANGELGVVEGGEGGAVASNGVGEDDIRAGVEVGGAVGHDEDIGANHATDARANEVAPSEGLAHVEIGASTNTYTIVRRPYLQRFSLSTF